ncbi:hypothetical protein [Sphingomonas soli]|uniref:hypothetical protein n=1 Tax=Sphingomonas soli TaxID=266127 RepID=UPI000AF50EBC|nr:hypothetical protein [Sphingomonas soli]
MEEQAFMVWAQDNNGDHHLFAANDLERAVIDFHSMKERYGNALPNEELGDAIGLVATA